MIASDDAVARYDELLSAGFHRSCRRALEENESQLCLASARVVHSLRPCLVPEREYRRAMQQTEAVARALSIVHHALTKSEAARAALHLDEEDEDAVAAEPLGSMEIAGRFDGIFDETGTLKFVEYNSLAAGMMLVDWMSSVYARMPIMAALRERFALRHESTASRIVPAFLRGFARRGGVGLPTIAMVSASPETSTMRFEEWTAMAELVADAGCPIVDARPCELEAHAGDVTVRGRRVDVVFFDDWPLLRRSIAPASPFWRAVAGGRVWLANSRANRLLRGDKRVFAVLSDPKFHGWLERDEARAVAFHVPWTRVLRPARTTIDGRAIDLLDVVRRDRERFVIKPAGSYGGDGVTLGWEATEREWDAAIDAALARPHVVQARVTCPREPYPFVEDDRVRVEMCHCDFAPYVWNETEVAGALARVSRAAVVNVSSGGSAVPVYSVAAA